MEFISFIIILMLIGCIWFTFVYRNDNTLCIIGIILIIINSICLEGAIEIYFNRNKPSAIDVYRGNTTLEIKETIRDSVVIKRDTVVIFKENNYEK